MGVVGRGLSRVCLRSMWGGSVARLLGVGGCRGLGGVQGECGLGRGVGPDLGRDGV